MSYDDPRAAVVGGGVDWIRKLVQEDGQVDVNTLSLLYDARCTNDSSLWASSVVADA